MARIEKVISTIDELVSAALIDSDNRYKIEQVTAKEWDDPEAGQKWADGEDAYCGEYAHWGTPEHDAYNAKRKEYAELRPSTHNVVTYRLSRDYSTRYILTSGIGWMVYSAWTKKDSYGHEMPTGTMTIPGMLKRLGRTDVSEKIKDAEKKQREAQEIRGRNYLRETLNKKLQDIEEWVNNNGAQIGVTVEMFQLPIELADKLKAENV